MSGLSDPARNATFNVGGASRRAKPKSMSLPTALGRLHPERDRHQRERAAVLGRDLAGRVSRRRGRRLETRDDGFELRHLVRRGAELDVGHALIKAQHIGEQLV